MVESSEPGFRGVHVSIGRAGLQPTSSCFLNENNHLVSMLYRRSGWGKTTH